MRELVVQRDGHCVFPLCGTPARCCDLGHISPYLPLEDGGPRGQTSPAKLAPLCRRHRRCKTFTRWTYRRRPDGTYEWADPGGTRYLVIPRRGGSYRLTTDTGPPTTPPPEPPDPDQSAQ
jgi:hypothetical protein